jgi:hypothetical protein
MKIKKIIKVVISFTFLLTTSLLSDVSGLGYGDSLKEAKVDALSDMSQVIKSEVRTLYKTHSTNEYSKSELKSQVSSNLPILGAEFQVVSEAQLKEVKVVLRSEKSTLLYSKKLETLNEEMQTLLKEIKKSHSKSFQLASYEKLFTLTKEYERYKSVAVILNPKKKYKSKITHSKVESEIIKLSSHIDSLELATTLLANMFKQKSIYIYPPHIVNNTTIAPFGSVLLEQLKGKIATTSNLYSAKYILVGEYIVLEKSMILNMQLLDIKTKDIVASKTVLINKVAYQGIVVKPKGVDFNTLLSQGVAVSSSLHVTLTTNKGSENLLFYEGEEIELFVKLNKMSYLYIVGYTQTADTKQSYLLELSEGEGNSRFVKFINADDASKWISLGAFTIEAPFGIESLQVIASNKMIKDLPNVKYDAKSGYYIISKKIKKALEYTRGLRPKRTKKIESSEDVMSFTTMKKI